MTLFSSLRQSLREIGLANTTILIAAKLFALGSAGNWRIHRYYFVAQPVPDSALLREPGSNAIVIRRVEADDPVVKLFPRPPEVIAARYKMGAQCLAAEKHGQFAGFLWIKESQYPEDEVRCTYVLEPPSVAVWDFDVYIEPAHPHRSHVRPPLGQRVRVDAAARRYRWTLSRISAFNMDSLAAHRRLGTRPIGSATFVPLGQRAGGTARSRTVFPHVGWPRHAGAIAEAEMHLRTDASRRPLNPHLTRSHPEIHDRFEPAARADRGFRAARWPERCALAAGWRRRCPSGNCPRSRS